MSFSDKDPNEGIVVTFAFAALTNTITSATVAIEVQSGNDTNPAAMLSGMAVVSGTNVSQRVIGGVAGCTYHLRCTIQTPDGSTYVLGNTLPVTRF